MKTLTRLQILVTILASVWTSKVVALDESEKEAIRQLSNQAAADYERGHYELALAKFSRAYQVAKVPKLAVWCARANAKLGRLLAASELYQQALSLKSSELWKGAVQLRAQRDAQQELGQLQPKIPTLTIVIQNESADAVFVTVDDSPVPTARLSERQLQDPGTHHVIGKRGDTVVSETVILAEGDKKQVVLRFNGSSPIEAARPAVIPSTVLAKPTALAPSTHKLPREHHGGWEDQRTWGWIGIGVGASGLALGATTGLLVAVKYGDLSDKCDQRLCQPRYQSEVDHYQTTRAVSTFGFIVAGVATVTGLALLLTAPKAKIHERFGVWTMPPVSMFGGVF